MSETGRSGYKPPIAFVKTGACFINASYQSKSLSSSPETSASRLCEMFVEALEKLASSGDDGYIETVAPPQMTVLLPVKDEARLIDHTFDAVLGFAKDAPDYAFIFVDDGSQDDTPRILEERIAASHCARITLTTLAVNGGKGRAIHTAMLACQSEFICFTDGDLAYPLDHLPEMFEALRTHDVVIGSRSLVHRRQRNTLLLRRVLGWGFNVLTRLVLNLPYRDMQAGLKGFRREAAHRIFSQQRIFDFSFDAEVLFLAKRDGFTITEIPARVSETHSYKVSKVSLIRDPTRMFVDLLKIRFNSLLGLYGQSHPSEFRHGGVRHPAGVRPEGAR